MSAPSEPTQPPAWAWACLIAAIVFAGLSSGAGEFWGRQLVALSGLLMGFGLREMLLHRRQK
ncbi:hypothetical protein BAJUN_01060 [Bajunvirus bajun]|uniref:Uncharacterized protein n=1 Tax=Brevundimonas phage vB_BgoS-Bajun TaxID=2948594 RepID=A0A9E7ST94_9CAUD|nr:hypothetical protein BAJUN_01060 [Brevundimonas phage vB_BgoS-Bajun]